MIKCLAVALGIASLNAAVGVAQPRFADDFQQGVGYVAVLEVIPDEDGLAKTCTLSGVQALNASAPSVEISPSSAYVIDACRKLRTAKWQVKRDASGNIEALSYFCRYVESSPDTAYCDRQLGL